MEKANSSFSVWMVKQIKKENTNCSLTINDRKPNHKKQIQYVQSSWWFQPIWNILVISQNGSLPQIGMTIKNI